MLVTNVVRSPGWDPGRHKELRNGLEVKIYIWKVVFRVSKKVSVLSGLYREASRRFRKLSEESESPPRVPPRPKGQHGLTGGTSPSRPCVLGEVESPPLYGKGGNWTRSLTRPPWCTPRAWRAGQHKPLAPLSLPLLCNSSVFVVSVALDVALPESLHHHHRHTVVLQAIPSTSPPSLAGSRRRRRRRAIRVLNAEVPFV